MALLNIELALSLRLLIFFITTDQLYFGSIRPPSFRGPMSSLLTAREFWVSLPPFWQPQNLGPLIPTIEISNRPWGPPQTYAQQKAFRYEAYITEAVFADLMSNVHFPLPISVACICELQNGGEVFWLCCSGKCPLAPGKPHARLTDFHLFPTLRRVKMVYAGVVISELWKDRLILQNACKERYGTDEAWTLNCRELI